MLYADEAGKPTDVNQRYLVLGGVAVHESQSWHVSSALERIVAKYQADGSESIELHGSPMYTGKKPWRGLKPAERMAAMAEALGVIHRGMPVFAVVVDKEDKSSRDPLERAFPQLCRMFDAFLARVNRGGSRHRGLIVFDKSSYELTLQRLVRGMRASTLRGYCLRHLAEVPLFLDSEASRLVQLADLVSYGMFLKYERGDERFSRRIEARMEGVETAEYVAAPCLR